MKKFFAKKTTIACTLFTAVLLFAFSGSHPTTGTGGYTGAPNDGVCTQCHTPSGNLDGTIEITGLPATITPNQTYPLTVTITDTSPGLNAVRAGFQMVSLKQNLANGGTFSEAAGQTNTQPKTAAGKSYIGHQPAKNFEADNTTTYIVDWTAPSSATGPVTVYGATIIANGASGNSGDKFVATNISATLDGGGMPLTATFTNIIMTSCNDTEDGAATVVAAGGSGGYTYLWDNGETNATAVMLSGGPHSVTVSDASSASIVESVIIDSPADITLQTISQSDALCPNSNTGTAEVLASGGSGGFGYDWGGGLTGSIQNNLPAGVYTVTATDINGCTETTIVTITEPAPIVINTISLIEPSCNGDFNGSIEVEATGGNGGFAYSWLTNGIGTPNGSSITDLPAGTYLVEVFDSEGCSNEIDITLGEPIVLLAEVATIDVNCLGGQDGNATASGTGGTGNYTYSWSNGETTATVSNFIAGPHSVTITDDNNCSSFVNFEISEPSTAVSAGIVVTTQPNCGNSDGTLSAFGIGGTSDYTYLWEDGTMSAVLTNIPAGIYSVTVTDANGCTATTEEMLNENDGISLAANNVVNNDCNGDSNGSATISASGGGGVYTYLWSNGGMNATEVDLPAGAYTITVTDIGSCTGLITIEITEPAAFTPNENISHISCADIQDGSIIIAPEGGTGEITYLWNTGSTNDTITDLVPGLYSVVLTDELNCSFEFEFTIDEPDDIEISTISSAVPNCPGDSTGFIVIEATGGTGNLSYNWSNGETGDTISELLEGDYTVTVTDANNCETTQSFTLEDPIGISIEPISMMPTCPESMDGSLTIEATGGAGAYTYLWSNGSTTSTNDSLPAGSYLVTITDMNGCENVTTVVLDAPLSIEPNITSTDESVNGASDGEAVANPTNGTAPYFFEWSNGETTDSIGGLSPGTYTVIITDSNGCEVEGTVVINNGDCSIESDIEISDISCFGLTDGSISITLTGAVEPVSYVWSDGAITPNNIDLEIGMYSVTATDANGCIIQIVDIEIIEPDPITVSGSIITDASSSTAQDGSISIDFTGGTGDLTIQYTNGDGEPIGLESFDSLATGTYGVLVTDENGCTAFIGPLEVGVISSTIDVLLSVNLYPIPASEFITINVSQKLDTNPTFYNYSGQKINLNYSQKNTNYDVDVSQLTNGLYYVKLVSDNQIKVMKILIAK